MEGRRREGGGSDGEPGKEGDLLVQNGFPRYRQTTICFIYAAVPLPPLSICLYDHVDAMAASLLTLTHTHTPHDSLTLILTFDDILTLQDACSQSHHNSHLHSLLYSHSHLMELTLTFQNIPPH